MKTHRTLSIAILALLVAAATGCIRSGDCGKEPFTFTVIAYDVDRVTELPHAVNDVVVYVFDRNDLFVREIETTVGATVKIPANEGDILKMVAWGNLGGGNESRPVLSEGDHINTAAVGLLMRRAGTGHQTPDDLFMGTALLSKETSGQIIPIFPKTGKIGISIYNIRQYYRAGDNEFTVVVKTTREALPFSGSLPGGEASYRLTGAFNDDDQFIVEPVNIFAEDNIKVEIYHNNVQLINNISTTTTKIDVRESLATIVSYRFWVPGNVNTEITLAPWETEVTTKRFR